MRLTVEREHLQSALAFVGKYSGKGNSYPALTHVKLTAKGGRLSVEATDIDQAARDAVTAEIEVEGSCCLPADLISKAVKQSSGVDVSISVDGPTARIEIGKCRYDISVLPGSDFPQTPMLDSAGAGSFVLPAGILSRLSKEVSFAESNEETRFYLCGTYWHCDDLKLSFCALDGKRLSLLSIDEPLGAEAMPGMIVPTFQVPAWDDAVAVTFSDAFIRLSLGSQIVASKLVEGSFPDYRRAIPASDTMATVGRVDMLNAARRIALVADDREHSIMMVGRTGEIAMSGQTSRGFVSETIEYDGPDFQTAMTSQNLIPTLESLKSERIDLRFRDHRSPVVFSGKDDPDRTAVVMPYADLRLADYLPREAA